LKREFSLSNEFQILVEYKFLHYRMFLQILTLSNVFTNFNIVECFYKFLHCRMFLQIFTLSNVFTNFYIVEFIKKNLSENENFKTTRFEIKRKNCNLNIYFKKC
jgi:hypothetical protein